jgi:ribosomal protein RSM22 (predicted rRNA methylase)
MPASSMPGSRMPGSRASAYAADPTTELNAALAAELQHAKLTRDAQLARAAGALMSAYRGGDPAASPVLDTPLAALAYAAYRMPATYAAVAAVLARISSTVDGRAASPLRTLVDVGGGTGAALWAAAAAVPTLAAATVLDRSEPALRLGRRLAARSTARLLRGAAWTRAVLTPLSLSPLAPADLVTMAYVLAELPAATGAALVSTAARAAAVVVVVEPGTPAGYRRVLAARGLLVREGLHIVAPCPHDRACPLADGTDWCHFATRLGRSPIHRRLKGGSLGYEDEKYAYVVAARAAPPARTGRVVRRPRLRPGLVELDVCTPTHGVAPVRISKRLGPEYRAARDVRWGDPWPAST